MSLLPKFYTILPDVLSLQTTDGTETGLQTGVL